jgi:beta-lactamase regulating signal transducer with metallopeptidase domain/peroxiredoxin
MNPLDILVFLDGAGYNIIRNLLSILWQSSLIFLAAYIITSFLRRHHDSIRHYVWFCAMLAVPMLPLISAVMNNINTPRAPIPVIPSYQPQTTNRNFNGYKESLMQEPGKMIDGDYSPLVTQAPAPVLSVTENKERHLFYPWAYLTLLYAAGVLLFIVTIINGRFNIKRWMNNSSDIKDLMVNDTFTVACGKIDYKGAYLLRESKYVYSPLSLGVFRKTIILPEKFADSVSPNDLYSVALHEISHLKRNDPLIYTVVAVIRALFFFHPLIWYASKKIVELAEYSCDDNVLNFTCEPISYAKMLARIASGLPENAIQTNLAAGAIFSRNTFFRRVEIILSDRSSTIRRLSLMAFSGILALSVISMVLALAMPLGEVNNSTGEQVNVTGRILYGDKPVKDAIIYLVTHEKRNKIFQSVEKIGESGSDGTFSFKIDSFKLNESYEWTKPTVIAYSPGYSLGWQKLEDNIVLGNITIKLTQERTISGTVRDIKGNYLKGAEIIISGIHDKNDTDRENVLESLTDVDKDLIFISGEKGEYTITNMPENSAVYLIAKAKGYAQEYYKTEIESGSKGIDFVLKQGGRITGKVTFGDTGKPARDVFVLLRGWGAYEPVKTDKNGLYVIESVLPGKSITAYVSLEGNFPEWTAEAYETVIVEEGKTTENIDFKLIKGGIVTGKIIVSDTGEPVQGHNVSADPSNDQLSITIDNCKTDRNGIYRLRVPPGKIKINTESPDGFKKKHDFRLVDINDGDTVSGIDFSFDRGLPVTVTTLSPEGNPVEGTAVTRKNTMDITSKMITGNEGSCVFTGFGEGEDLEVYAENSKLKLKGEGAIKASKGANLQIKMGKYKTYGVGGQVLDTDGNPVKNARLYLYDRKGIVSMRQTASVTKSDGVYDVDNLIVGNDYSLNVEAEGYATYSIPLHKLLPEEKTDSVKNPLKSPKPVYNVYLDKADRWLEGKLVDDEGNPVKGAQISNTNDAMNNVTVFSNADGSFRMEKLVHAFESMINIAHSDFGYYEFRLVPTNSKQTFTLTKKNWKLVGKLVDTENKPIAGARISVNPQRRESGFMYMGGTKTDSNGGFLIDPVIDRELDISIYRENIGFKEFHIKTDEGALSLVFDKPDEHEAPKIEFDSHKPVFLEGQNPPEIDAVKWLNGSPVKLKDLKGKTVILDFWTCDKNSFIKTQEALNAIQKVYGSKSVVVIGIHENTDDVSKIEKVIKDLGLTYRIAVDKKGANAESGGKTFDKFGMYKKPNREELAFYTIIDKSGQTHQNISIFSLDSRVKDILRGGK